MFKLTPVEGTLQLIDDETGEVLDDVFFKTPYNHNRNAEADRVATVCPEPTLTDQSFKEEVDINTIMERIRAGEQHSIPLPEHFGDGTNIPTLLDAYDKIAATNATFYELPPNVRFEFRNDPRIWMEQVYKDLQAGNVDALNRMGIEVELIPKRQPAAPQGASPAPGTPASATDPGKAVADDKKTDPK